MDFMLDNHIHKFSVLCLQFFDLFLRFCFLQCTGLNLNCQFILELAYKLFHLINLVFKIGQISRFLALEIFHFLLGLFELVDFRLVIRLDLVKFTFKLAFSLG